MKPAYLTFTQLAFELGYRGKYARTTARDWALRKGIPKYERSKAVWVVKWADVETAIERSAPAKKKAAPAGTGNGLERSL